MVILKFLGIIDILTMLFFWISFSLHIIPGGILFFFAIILLIKGVAFSLLHDFVSIGDIICSLIIILSIYTPIHIIISTIVCIYLLQKGIFSML